MKVGRRGFLGMLAAIGLGRLLPETRPSREHWIAHHTPDDRVCSHVFHTDADGKTMMVSQSDPNCRCFILSPRPDPACVGDRKSAVGAA